ncbi:hypothetical protein [Muriicola sp. Z0-33]|uniref:hypothetical protein n=1 Tax=Muriicola sp. Z0-33 TaxID=2816957 RepID=UPI0022381EEF|nr:hypothetical protein [Muriicola sp. Z0-33]MCW5515615.1 hypothetical protein [Muriicola sp. Z0-33]
MWQQRDRRDLFTFLFPRYLILLVMLPLIIGMIIDQELVQPITFLVNLVWMLPFTFPYYIFRRRVIYNIAAIFYFITGMLEIGHWIVLKEPLTMSSLLNFLNTKYEDIGASIELSLDSNLWFLLLYTLLFIVALRNPPKVEWYRLKISILALIVMVFTTIGLVLFNFFPKKQLVPPFAKVFYTTTVQWTQQHTVSTISRLSRTDDLQEISVELNNIKQYQKPVF